MKKSLCFVFCALFSGPLAAEVYKWIDENGSTHYGEHPPANASAIYVDVRPNLMEGLKKQDCRDCPTGKLDQPAPALPTTVAPAPIHGLPFEIFIQIQRGMSEAEVVLRAGTPDQEVTEGTQEHSVAIASTTKNTNPQTGQAVRNTIVRRNTSNLVIKTYYYLPTIADPFTTIITFRGGWVNDIQRIRKL
ncbi:MAG: DUF4124 domain-containing protein [Burkholderiales bacterium]